LVRKTFFSTLLILPLRTHVCKTKNKEDTKNGDNNEGLKKQPRQLSGCLSIDVYICMF